MQTADLQVHNLYSVICRLYKVVVNVVTAACTVMFAAFKNSIIT